MSKELKKDRDFISAMFNGIADRYDSLNHILSWGMDRIWRKRLVKSVASTGAKYVLDLACGTGDVTRALYKKDINVVGMDIAERMVDIAKIKVGKVVREKKIKDVRRSESIIKRNNAQNLSENAVEDPKFIIASAEDIPSADCTFDAITISFGIRNFDNKFDCLKECHRVIKDDGHLFILEFAIPKNRLWATLYLFYFKKVLPFVGKLISHNSFAYNYLPNSVEVFPQYEDFCQELVNAGFHSVKYEKYLGGIALLYHATK